MHSVVREDVGRIWSSAGRRGVRADGHVISLENALRTKGSKLPGAIVAATFNVMGDVLATLDSNGQLIAFYLHQNRYSAVKRTGARAVAIAFSPHRRTELFVALADGTIDCIDTASKAVVGSLKGHIVAARTLAVHPTQTFLLSCAGDELAQRRAAG